jgi:hypothetical protein
MTYLWNAPRWRSRCCDYHKHYHDNGRAANEISAGLPRTSQPPLLRKKERDMPTERACALRKIVLIAARRDEQLYVPRIAIT